MSNQFLVSHLSSVRHLFTGREETACSHEAGACSPKISNNVSHDRGERVSARSLAVASASANSRRVFQMNRWISRDVLISLSLVSGPQGLWNGISRRRVIKINYRFPEERAKYLENASAIIVINYLSPVQKRNVSASYLSYSFIFQVNRYLKRPFFTQDSRKKKLQH